MATSNGNGTVAVKPPSEFDNFKSLLHAANTQSALSRALPKHVKVEKIISAALTAAQMNPAILECSKSSVLRSIMIASMLGLEPGGALGSAYLVPFKGVCTLIPGYRGLIDLARRSGSVKGVEARVVYDCDTFDYSYGTDAKITHIPRLERPEGARFIAAYCVVTLADGTKQIEIMGASEIDGIKAKSKAAKSGPWVDHYDEMARKTVVRRALKYAPLSTELAQAVALDDRAEAGVDQGAGIIDIAPEDIEAPPTTADAVRARLDAQKNNDESGPRAAA